MFRYKKGKREIKRTSTYFFFFKLRLFCILICGLIPLKKVFSVDFHVTCRARPETRNFRDENIAHLTTFPDKSQACHMSDTKSQMHCCHKIYLESSTISVPLRSHYENRMSTSNTWVIPVPIQVNCYWYYTVIIL